MSDIKKLYEVKIEFKEDIPIGLYEDVTDSYFLPGVPFYTIKFKNNETLFFSYDEISLIRVRPMESEV